MNREALLRRIGVEGRVTFRDAMDAALYDPEDGWYGAGKASIGVGGDFTTSPELSPVFGACVATWIVRQWERLLRPAVLSVVEFGAGKGSLARAALDTLREEAPEAYECVRYVLVERSSASRSIARAALLAHAEHVEVSEAFGALEESAAALFVSNEFVDALPVHAARVVGDGRLEELFVTAGPDGRLSSCWDRPSTERIAEYARRFVPAVESGHGFAFEAGLEAWDWITSVTDGSRAGAILTFDYGDVADRVAGPRHPQGTLRAMRARRPVADVVASLFEADLTVDVNFDVLASTALSNGWAVAPLVSQGEWLARLGALDRIARAAAAPIAERLAMKALLTPGGLGERMKVLELERARNPER